MLSTAVSAEKMQDKEYNPSTHEYGKATEFAVPKDFKSGVADEYNVDTSAYDVAVIKASKEKRANTKKKTVILQTAAAITTVVVATSSFGYDLLGYDIFNSGSSYSGGSGGSGYVQPVTDPYPDENVEARIVLVTYVPTGESRQFHGETFSIGYEKAYDWAKLVGGLDVEMVFTGAQKFIVGYDKSDDAIIIGDPDAPFETWYIPQGTVTPIYDLYYYYEAYPKGLSGGGENQPGEHADNAFPVLDNLEPNGVIPGYGVINEDYVMLQYFRNYESMEAYDVQYASEVSDVGRGVYLWAGTAYGLTDSAGNPTSCRFYDEYKSRGTYYDRASNTLFLNNFSGAGLNINIMGNGFKLHVTGDCHLDRILAWGFMYGGSITITGNGTLTVNEQQAWECGIQFLCEGSASCLMIDSGVTVESYGTVSAIELDDCTLEKGIYYLSPLKLSEGERNALEKQGEVYDHMIISGAEGPLKHVKFSK